MTDPRFLETEIGTPAASLRTPIGRRGLPEDLLREAAKRLGIICLVAAGIWTIEFVLSHIVLGMPGMLPEEQVGRQWLRLYDVVGLINVAVSLALFWYTRRSKRSQTFLLDLGLVYEVFTAASIGLLDYVFSHPMGVSWIAIVIVLFPPIVPNTPGKTLTAALVAASMGPVAALFWSLVGHPVPPVPHVLMQAIPNYLSAGVAVVISHIMTRLGREVRKAREMGSYVLGDLIGKGGMGEVWQATHRFLVRPAAIKLIKPAVLEAVTREQADVLVQRFKREARAAAMLRSPHTIQLYDFGVSGDGTFYYVMELLNGMDLQSLVTRFGPLPPARAVHVLAQACESLGEAHERGMIHRDIKPANIQVCQMGSYYDFVKVLDFGLVKLETHAAKPEPGLTAPELLAGTPAYLAPENALGEPVDQRTDIYALGCVAYWMLTGRLVFDGDSPLQIVARHIQATPEPPSRYSPFPVRPDLEKLVLDCLAKSPEDRPTTVGDLSERLARCALESPWTRAAARQWWETSLGAQAPVG